MSPRHTLRGATLSLSGKGTSEQQSRRRWRAPLLAGLLMILALLGGSFAASSSSAACPSPSRPQPSWPQPPDPVIQQIMDGVTTTDLMDIDTGLSGEHSVIVGGQPYTFTTRYSRNSAGIQKTWQYAYEQFQEAGWNTSYQDYTAGGYSLKNIIAEKEGTVAPTTIYLLTAHIDDTSNNPSNYAPGADDNGSGSSLLIDAARVLAEYPMSATVRIVAFTGEEQGLWGSNAYAAAARARGDNIQGVLNADMIAWDSNNDHAGEIHAGTRSDSQAIASVFSNTVTTYGIPLYLNTYTTDSETGSDHSSFWQYNYPAFLAIELDKGGDFNEYYHTTNDRVNCGGINPCGFNQSYFTAFSKALVGTLARLAVASPPGTPTPTVTGTPPTATPTLTSTHTPTATNTPCEVSGVIQNGGFEAGNLGNWVVDGTNPAPTVRTTQPHSSTYSAFLGSGPGTEPLGDSSFFQAITVPSSGGILSFWYYPYSEDSLTFDWQDAYITDLNGNILATFLHVCNTSQTWTNITYNLAPYAGQTVRIKFLVHQDGFGDVTNMYLDDVRLLGSCGTPQPTETETTEASSTVPVPTGTEDVTATRTRETEPSATNTSTSTGTPLLTNTVPRPTNTSEATATLAATSTACAIHYSDVPAGSTFYNYVRCLACRGIVSGYLDGTFRPGNNITRGQIAKIVAGAAGLNDQIPDQQQTFEDVSPGSTFWLYIERLYQRGVMVGYPCGGGVSPGSEPCVPPANRPYFRPNNAASRGQLAKIVANLLAVTPLPMQMFEDVSPGSTFYDFIQKLASLGIISGYLCGGSGEPCVPPENRPYFRPYATVTRGQSAKIVSNTFFPNCQTP